MPDSEAPFNIERFRQIAKALAEIHACFDVAHFLAISLSELEPLSLMQRLRRMTQSLHATVPADYRKTLLILRQLAPRISHGFVTLMLPDYVALYGLDDFDVSMDALKFSRCLDLPNLLSVNF